MKVVVDTNVFVSAALKQGSLPSIALYQASQHCVFLKSKVTEAQLFEVLARNYIASLIKPETLEWIMQIMATAEPVTIVQRIAACRDPTDDKFLELAVNGKADLILTGDNDPLVLNPFQGIPIVTPTSFVQGASRS